MKVNKPMMQQLLAGSTILGTGGGGRYDEALQRIKDIRAVELLTVDELPADAVVITAYGAGGLTKPKVNVQALKNGLRLLQKRLGKPIDAIVPVEIGPYSLAEAFWVATQLKVPVIDADLVGCRSVPEIFIELVTLAGLSRCPLVFGNSEGDLVLLETESSAERLEQLVRSFADLSISNTFVLGYPFSKAQLLASAAKGSVSYCLGLKDKLALDFQLAGKGRVVLDEKQEKDGFTRGRLQVKQNKARFTIEYKNEYLVLLKDGKLSLTCPDFICIIDDKTGLGLNNGEANVGKQVSVYIRPAIRQWQTLAARKLFSPKALGLDYQQKVLRG
jgi:DUF917 family protein